MGEISGIENRIESVTNQIQSQEDRLTREPNNFALSISIRSLKDHLKELQEQLRYEKEVREKEVIELRLKGKSVDNGSIPLHLLGNISQFWADAILAGANQIKLGGKAKQMIPKEILESLDLRLAGIGMGSTRLFITGRSSPDLFGNSLLEDTLRESFGLLSSKSGDELTEKVGRLGKRTAKSINNFLKTVTSQDLEIDITWNSPTLISYTWEGTNNKILQLSESLEKLSEKPPELLKFIGEIISVSMRKVFEILDDSNISYKGTFPDELLARMQECHIGQRCSGTLIKKRIVNQVTGYEKNYFELKNIKTS